MGLPIWIINKMRNKIIKKIFEPTNLNEGENDVIEEMKNPNSPMYKNVSEWDEWDRWRAETSPSYENNYYLQRQVEEYDMNIVKKHLQDWKERDKLQRR